MNTSELIIETIVVAYQEFIVVAPKIGKNPDSLKDFMGAMELYLKSKKEAS